MCELLGLSFNEPVKPSLAFRGFRHRGRQNPDGWGIAWYNDGLNLVKQPINAEGSDLSYSMIYSDNLESKIFVAHVRRASRGSNKYSNTHPFDCSGICFAHNGTIRNHEILSTGIYTLLGDTDSEQVFYNLLINVEFSDFDSVYNYLREINQQGSINCLLSNGDYLFCYSDANNHNQGLKYVKREPPYGIVNLADEDFEIDLSLEKDASQKGYVIASRPLTNEEWVPFSNGELKVFRNGEIVYSSHKLTYQSMRVLKGIRESPHSISKLSLSANIGVDIDEVSSIVDSLLFNGYLKENSIQRGTYYTHPDKRPEIERLIKDID